MFRFQANTPKLALLRLASEDFPDVDENAGDDTSFKGFRNLSKEFRNNHEEARDTLFRRIAFLLVDNNNFEDVLNAWMNAKEGRNSEQEPKEVNGKKGAIEEGHNKESKKQKRGQKQQLLLVNFLRCLDIGSKASLAATTIKEDVIPVSSFLEGVLFGSKTREILFQLFTTNAETLLDHSSSCPCVDFVTDVSALTGEFHSLILKEVLTELQPDLDQPDNRGRLSLLKQKLSLFLQSDLTHSILCFAKQMGLTFNKSPQHCQLQTFVESYIFPRKVHEGVMKTDLAKLLKFLLHVLTNRKSKSLFEEELKKTKETCCNLFSGIKEGPPILHLLQHKVGNFMFMSMVNVLIAKLNSESLTASPRKKKRQFASIAKSFSTVEETPHQKTKGSSPPMAVEEDGKDGTGSSFSTEEQGKWPNETRKSQTQLNQDDGEDNSQHPVTHLRTGQLTSNRNESEKKGKTTAPTLEWPNIQSGEWTMATWWHPITKKVENKEAHLVHVFGSDFRNIKNLCVVSQHFDHPHFKTASNDNVMQVEGNEICDINKGTNGSFGWVFFE